MKRRSETFVLSLSGFREEPPLEFPHRFPPHETRAVPHAVGWVSVRKTEQSSARYMRVVLLTEAREYKLELSISLVNPRSSSKNCW